MPISKKLYQDVKISSSTWKHFNVNKMLHENSDFIWKLSGDKSNDFSYYSKRGLLSMIYLATLFIG